MLISMNFRELRRELSLKSELLNYLNFFSRNLFTFPLQEKRNDV